MKRKLFLTFFLCFALVFSMQAQNKIEFTEYDLDNGLHVILHQDKSTPIVAVTVLYHVGAKNEDPTRTGFAHFFEHLLFEGSENIGRGEYMKKIQSAGGALNANTTNDRTFYYEVLPSNQLELGLYMESERMLHAKIDQVGVDTQREVVKEEKRQRYDNQPYMSFQAKMFENAFKGTNYEWSTIGSLEHLNEATLDEFIEFYNTFYVPNNATLSIAGDINIEETKKLVAKYFQEIPKGTKEIPRPTYTAKPAKKEVREVVYDNIQLPAVFQGYNMPAQGTADFYAMDMLNTLLSGGASSRLNKELVDKQEKALQVVSFPFAMEDAGIFITLGLVSVGTDVGELEAAMDAEIEKVKNELITDTEFQKIQNQVENKFVSSNATVSGIAESLANYHVYFDDANLINNEIKRYNSVTKEDIKRVANKYLTKENRVVLQYLPKSAQKQPDNTDLNKEDKN